ncbi:TolB-like translocation protein [Cyclobacterium marinum]|uniref:WD40-like beta Propeller containing protein n=1 Tax=Cyclobacterium marinum (strain ATCC 25205 / DSM 745 / LMG 13164 / NCIMB 1802) TaxID=880070 RepID=G0J2L1_CYCMS|nr:hypothetical protein [Cyclobacterium marinum]AEL26594.1 hypothetical protein Cycma_2856 [Cyclobacterium marinum DSM 745]
MINKSKISSANYFRCLKFFKALLFIVFLLNSRLLKAQEDTDLFLVESKKNLFGFTIFPETAKKISKGEGYDNQPSFINKSQLVFTSKDPAGNFDVILYNLDTDKYTNMTRTQGLDEFSPKLTSCGQYISTVRVEKDSSQRIWLYPINFGEPELLYDDIEPVGYYGWHGETAALFLVGSPNRLVYPYSREEIFEIAENPGRCISQRPGTNEIVYVDKNSNIISNGREAYELKAFDVKSRQTKTIGITLAGAEDFVWIDKNNLLMARDKTIYLKNISKGTGWEEIATLNTLEYRNISRIALSPDNKNLVITMEPSK